MKKLLITGGSGFLGWNLCAAAPADWDVWAICRDHPVDIPKVRFLRFDLTNYADLKQAIRDVRPDAVIHAAAISDIDACQRRRTESRRINVDVSASLAGLCADQGRRFLFTSSDLVFDGSRPPYAEAAPPTPINAYGEQKAVAESEIMARFPEAVICRMPLMFGDAGPVARSFLQPLIAALAEETPVNAFIDEFRTPLSGAAAAAGLLWALDSGRGEILHIAGRERISRYEFAHMVAAAAGFSVARLVGCRQADVATRAQRPPDVSLDCRKAIARGYTVPSLVDQVHALECLADARATRIGSAVKPQ